MNYKLASTTDLAADELFAHWVLAPTAESNAFWQDWLEQNPAKQAEVEEARMLVQLLSVDVLENSEADIDKVWVNLQQAIQQEETREAAEVRVIPLQVWKRKGLWQLAAAVLFLFVSSLLLLQFKTDSLQYATAFGEKRSIELPDGSLVVLNANSSIVYTNSWPGLSARRVFLKGEAYFKVAHKGADQRFIVQTPEGTEVEVFGTEFNVKSRTSDTRVVLASGEVHLSFEHKGKATQLVMEPGELVEVSATTGLKARERVKTELYTAWKDGRIVFDNTSLREIASMLEQIYGYKVVIEDAALAEQRLTANFKEQGMENILATVSATLGAKVTRQKEVNTILISNI